jgi:flagellar biosynthesis/type III secretory pathway protein FliH
MNPTPDLDLSPLDQIRQTEADVLRKTAAARKTGEEILENAQLQAETLRREAQEAGTTQGQARYKVLVSGAGEEAQILVKEAHDFAKKLRRASLVRMQAAVVYAVEFVIFVSEDGNEK